MMQLSLLTLASVTILLLCRTDASSRPAAVRLAKTTPHVVHVPKRPGGPSHVVFNIGSNRDPPAPFNDTLIVAVEPLPDVASKIEPVPNRLVMTAAVSDHFGVAMFNHFDISSSLLQPERSTDHWTAFGRQGEPVLVPVVPLSALLEGFAEYECSVVKTDMQGMDFTAIRGAGAAITRCRHVFSETNCNGLTHYKDAVNDFHRDWLPHMSRLGFKPETFCGDFQGETNILWKNTRYKEGPVPTSVCPSCYGEIVACKDVSCLKAGKAKSVCGCESDHAATW